MLKTATVLHSEMLTTHILVQAAVICLHESTGKFSTSQRSGTCPYHLWRYCVLPGQMMRSGPNKQMRSEISGPNATEFEFLHIPAVRDSWQVFPASDFNPWYSTFTSTGFDQTHLIPHENILIEPKLSRHAARTICSPLQPP